MKKIQAFFLAFLAFSSAIALSCSKPAPAPEPEPEPVDLVDFKLSVPVTENWVFTDKPSITIHVEKPNEVAVKAEAKMRISTDLKEAVTTVEKTVDVPAKGSVDIPFTTDSNLDPGFYRALCSVNGRIARNFSSVSIPPRSFRRRTSSRISMRSGMQPRLSWKASN